MSPPHAPPPPLPRKEIIPPNSINPSTSSRLWTIAAFIAVIVMGVPYWWYTTSIERLPLPYNDITRLESYTDTFTFNIPITLTTTASIFPPPNPDRPPPNLPSLVAELKVELEKEADYWVYKALGRRGEKRGWWLDDSPGNRHDLFVHTLTDPSAPNTFPLKPYFSQTSLPSSSIDGYPLLVPAGSLILPIHPDQTSARMLRYHMTTAIAPLLQHLLPVRPPATPSRAIGYSENVTLSFVLLNEDSSDGGGVGGWDLESALKGSCFLLSCGLKEVLIGLGGVEYILPHLKLLQGTHRFTIESQVLFHAPLRTQPVPRRVGGGKVIDEGLEAEGGEAEAEAEAEVEAEMEWVVDGEGLKGFINSEKWKLDSGSSKEPVLRFLLFVPKVGHRPMVIDVPDGSPAFIIPQSAGLYILNPPSPSPSTLSLTALLPPFSYFQTHLSLLLGLPPLPTTFHPTSAPAAPANPFQVMTYQRARLEENWAAGRKRLGGVGRLVRGMGGMRVGKGVKGEVEGGVGRLRKMKKLNNTGDPAEVFQLSKEAMGMSNKAFFNPTMVGLLYFPDEHKYAVYAPLFAPVAVPIVVALIKEVKRWRTKRAEKRKRDAAAEEVRKQVEEPEGKEKVE